MKRLSALLLLLIFFIAGCSSNVVAQTSVSETVQGLKYKQISQEEAQEMMTKDDGHVIVDVRRQDEYDAGHIPGAILIPNESIDKDRPQELPDLNQTILVYCRSGRRSKEASEKLANMGYVNIYEFGGIITWPGETVR
ncbi:MAG: rhodanese-like domain-containing protein [Clostridiales bacterium]|nr:rhodanese-like domain-containing protein [Clostridiales bacterium]